MGSLFQSEKKQLLGEKECFRDYTFIGTEVINKYLIENKYALYSYEAVASTFIDLMVISFLVIWCVKFNAFRLFPAYIAFYSIRAFIQNRFLMGRPDGFLWE